MPWTDSLRTTGDGMTFVPAAPVGSCACAARFELMLRTGAGRAPEFTLTWSDQCRLDIFCYTHMYVYMYTCIHVYRYSNIFNI